MRYIIVQRAANAPKSGGGKYRRPVTIRVLDATASEWHAVRRLTPGVVAEWKNVDSRYTGPRSAYGKAMADAEALADELNAEISLSCVI